MARVFKAFAAILSVTLAVGSAAAQTQQSSNRVTVQSAWSVFVDGNPRECWAVSQPTESVNTRDGRPVTVRRGTTLLFVTYRQGHADAPEIAFTGGYPFRQGSTVKIDIGNESFELFTEGEWAWAGSPEDDERILAAMRRGQQAVVTGVSSRGTTTRDTFSLFGVTAATDEARRRCAN